MTAIRLLPEHIFDGEQWHKDTAVVVFNDTIISLEAPNGEEIAIDGDMVPGFIDVQVNGGGGVLFNATPTESALAQIIKTHSLYGSCGILPTLVTDSVEVMQQAANAVANVIKDKVPGILGVHFEGPHLSVEKKGVHSTDYIRPLTDAEKAIFSRDDLGIKVVTLAPENVSPEDIRFLADANVKVCLGHSNATFEQTKEALGAGATGFTHLYNAMSPFQSRDPGVVGAALEDQNSWCGLIVDGHHVHPAAAKVAIAAKPTGKIMLVTDAMPPVGTNDESFEFFGASVTRTGDRLNAESGSLAGSCLDMAGAVRNTVNTLDVSVEEALRMAALYPAQFLGIDGTQGKIEAGYKANMVILDKELQITGCWLAGKPVF